MGEDQNNCESPLYRSQWWFYAGVAAFILLILVFFKNAWVCDDAYINFRSVEQLFAGNGPNWNPHQRVQIYTSPLWYWLLAAARLGSNDHFFNAIILSFVLFLLLTFSIYRSFSSAQAALAFSLLAASNSFMDFTSSGLENVLCSLLLFLCIKLSKDFCQSKTQLWVMVVLSLLPICRHDLITFMLPLAIFVATTGFSGIWPRIRAIFLMFVPLLFWTAFSLFYYGAVFPNTAYAKILTGIPRLDLLLQGAKYFLVTFQQDPVTILAILGAIVLGFRSEKKLENYIAGALSLNLFYILWVGGDFMRGRFFSSAFIVAVLLLVENFSADLPVLCRKKLCLGAVLLFLVYLLGFPSTPLNTGLNHTNFNLDYGIADERGYYFDVCSLYSYLYSKPGEIFPDFEWSHIGRQIATAKVSYLENDFNGMLGYWAGTKPIIIDRLALADPFLARNPVEPSNEWRIGHFKRKVPQKYRESVEKGENLFEAGKLRNLYELLELATRSEKLFSLKRFEAILRLNLQLY